MVCMLAGRAVELRLSEDQAQIRRYFVFILSPKTVLIKHRVSTSFRLLQQAMPEGQSVWEGRW